MEFRIINFYFTTVDFQAIEDVTSKRIGKLLAEAGWSTIHTWQKPLETSPLTSVVESVWRAGCPDDLEGSRIERKLQRRQLWINFWGLCFKICLKLKILLSSPKLFFFQTVYLQSCYELPCCLSSLIPVLLIVFVLLLLFLSSRHFQVLRNDIVNQNHMQSNHRLGESLRYCETLVQTCVQDRMKVSKSSQIIIQRSTNREALLQLQAQTLLNSWTFSLCCVQSSRKKSLPQ